MGLPLDPLLAAFYKQWGKLSLTTDQAGVFIIPWGSDSDDSPQAENNLQTENKRWRGTLEEQQAYSALLFFAGEPNTLYRYATMPELADAQGLQPVVHVDLHEEPYALPIASSVDLFFDLYARYLKELASTPRHGATLLSSFPLEVPHLFAPDRRLVGLIRDGHFEPLLSPAARTDVSVQQWLRKILEAAW
jgi:hypothetical protein